jgi:hypothetical protein
VKYVEPVSQIGPQPQALDKKTPETKPSVEDGSGGKLRKENALKFISAKTSQSFSIEI